MYFPHYDALLLHPGKTAGTSVEDALAPTKRDVSVQRSEILFGHHGTERYYMQHATAASARRELGAELFDRAYRFATVRDPFARIVSVYHYLFPQHEERFGGFRQFVLQLPDLANQKAAQRGNHFSPQTFHTHLDGRLICHRLVRFESLHDDFARVAADLSISLRLKHRNAYRHESFPSGRLIDLYDSDMIDAMRSAYGDDFRELEYPDYPGGSLG